MGRMRQWGTSAFKDSKGMYYKNEKGHLLESVVFLQDPVVEAGIMKSLQATSWSLLPIQQKRIDMRRFSLGGGILTASFSTLPMPRNPALQGNL